MISFESFRMESGTPIYLQILLFIKRGVIAGTICDGDELPSRRVLSAHLGVNPNTVQKAYRLLEEDGLICSHTGSRSFMQITAEKTDDIRRELLETDIKSMVSTLRQMGLSKDDAISLLDTWWK